MSQIALATVAVVAGASFLTPTTLPPELPLHASRSSETRTSPVQSYGTSPINTLRPDGVVRLWFEDSGVEIFLDDESEEYHVTARPGHSSEILGRYLDGCRRWGYEPLDEDEAPAEILADDSVRIYLAEVA